MMCPLLYDEQLPLFCFLYLGEMPSIPCMPPLFYFQSFMGRSVLQYNADTYSRLYSITFEEVNFVSLDWT